MFGECFSGIVEGRRNVLGFEIGMFVDNVVHAHPSRNHAQHGDDRKAKAPDSAATRKLRPALTPPQARQVVHDYSDWCTVDSDPLLIISASELSEQHSINFWDALIVEAALRAGAVELVTEDLQNGRQFDYLTVRNPFPTP